VQTSFTALAKNRAPLDLGGVIETQDVAFFSQGDFMLVLGRDVFRTQVAGIDEAGRGPLAGPVVAAAVVLPEGYRNAELNDSKKLSAKKREALAEIIKRDAELYAVVAVGHRRIDRLNIREATRFAMGMALERVSAELALIDGDMTIETTVAQRTVVKGDGKFQEIAAASILAKVSRDEMMVNLGLKYPGYGFEKHAGYPTKNHKEAIRALGVSRVHRRSFRLQ
jgi:ribonuclease HII